MVFIGRLDKEIYRRVTPDIITDEVILTDTQIKHIMERHPGNCERFFRRLAEIVAEPDYILEANKPYSGVVLKEIRGDFFKLVLRLAVPADEPAYKNSIITFMKIDKKDRDRLIRNKKVLYKRE